jgi:DNA-binding NtrC family response regulator
VEHILIVDDEPSFCETVRDILEDANYQVSIVHSGNEALAFVTRNHDTLDGVLLDIKMPGMSGLEVLPQLTRTYPSLPVIMLSGAGTVDTAVTAMQLGAQNFLEKPPDEERLLQTVQNAMKKRRTHAALGHAGTELESLGVIAESAAMKRVLADVEQCAPSEIPVLIVGETGVGKEVIARCVHQFSKRAAKKFVTVDVPSIPASMFESEVFGHTKGAFTGAIDDKNGLFHEADGGTIFLDEIGELSMEMQPKFLRVLQAHEVKKLGSVNSVHVDARVVSATNRDLISAIRQQRMREDLYYRLRGVEIYILPLRERREDIGPLATYFLKKSVVRHGLTARGFTDSALSFLSEQRWSGNARELELFVERSAVFATTEYVDTMLLATLLESRTPIATAATDDRPSYTQIDERTRHVGDQMKREELVSALVTNRWNITMAAAALGIDRSTLSKQMKRLNISKPGEE